MSYASPEPAVENRTSRPIAEDRIGRFRSRLRACMKGTTLRAFARAAGVSEGVLRKWTNGPSLPTVDTLVSLADAAGVSVGWLATGEGPMRPGEGEGGRLGDRLVRVPVYFFRPDAGAGDQAPAEDALEELALPQRWVERELGVPASRLVVVTARGDSMEPTISDGDLLLVDTGQNEPGADGVYVMRRGAGVAIKRLELRHDGSITIRSDNPAYSEYTLPRDQAATLTIVGRVVWAGGKM